MGCGQSKIQTEDTVARCKLRKQHMADAVVARNAFAAAQSGYAVFLKNAGAAICDFSRAEFQHPHAPSASATVHAPYETPLPPPPLPEFAAPLQRAASMPEISVHKAKSKLVDPIIEEENEEESEKESHSLKLRSSRRGGNRVVASEKGVPEEGLTEPPPAPPLEKPQIGPSPPPPPGAKWGEYLFSPMENLPGSTLDAEVVDEDRMQIERKAFEEISMRDEVVDSVGVKPAKGVTAETTTVVPVKAVDPLPAKAVKKVKQDAPAESSKKDAPAEGSRKGGKSGTISSLVQIFVELDDYFLKASQSAHEVLEMLQANRMHYHSNFADNRGHMNHSSRILYAITWNRSFGLIDNEEFPKDDSDLEDNDAHATVLDMMLAWEKKLYDEMKTGEYMKLTYQRKFTSLHRLNKRGASTEAIEKTKAALSNLHTRYIVDIQSMDKTVSEINRLRDQQLFPKLVRLVDGMATMWETMRTHHEKQAKIATALRSLDISHFPREVTTDHHHNQTEQLVHIIQGWHLHFENLIIHQNKYIRALNTWLRLNLIHVDKNAAEKIEKSPTHHAIEDYKQAEKYEEPPIQVLLLAWHDSLEKLPYKIASTAISNLAEAFSTILHYQAEELKLRNKCEETRKEISRKTKQYEDWCNKDMKRRKADDDIIRAKELIAEKQLAVEVAKQRLEDYEEHYKMLCVQAREQSFIILKAQLPEFFLAMLDFSRASSAMYRNLWSISQAPEQ